jgi:metal-responsive CopG/Arc/MetJ family transcriptional regulator
MANPKTRSSRVFTISFPEDLAQQVEKVAQEESRTISELFREAFRTYRVDRAHRSLEKTRAEVHARGPQRYTEEDIEGIVDEIRSEMYSQRRKVVEEPVA